MAIMSSFGGNERDRYLGFAEASNGLGILIGPLGGALLYHIGGFPFPFFFLSSLITLMSPFIVYILYVAAVEGKVASMATSDRNESIIPKQEVRYLDFFKKPRFVFGLVS